MTGFSQLTVRTLHKLSRVLLHFRSGVAPCVFTCVLFCAWPAQADLIIGGSLITHSGHVVDTLSSKLVIKGARVRRSLEGQGTLADFFGRRVEILNRTTGASTVLDLDLNTYTQSAGAPQACHPWNLFDLRWLGRVSEGQEGELAWPDTSATLLGLQAHAIDIRFATRQKGGSTIRFWVVYELDSLFGPEVAPSLFCGVPEAEADNQLSKHLARQFGLSVGAIEALNKVRLGFPVRIESFMGQGKSRMDLSRFETLTVQRTNVADSLFNVPAAFQPADGAGHE